MTNPDYAVGQAWTYRTRPGEEASRVAIRRIDREPEDGEVFHVSILGVKLRNHRLPGGTQPAMNHAAVSRATLDASLLAHEGAADTDEAWRDGYAVWRQAYDNGDAGIFDLPIPEILGYIEMVVAASGEAR
ncbi:hypothetical protein SAMN02800694_0789 [Luteibacter sp. UNCMF331Sha3.1]|uniref:hypothetical protein n=1 Tax=Luteibacter sp. UNCMF331Sha3.1 TaxID=1502760 RepID=UPI0008B75F84|nr:hypothetical protein [Luteibacter sp. UNCMF331Sha3.1]SEM36225.1 hypothetical protein SAMN02800694_0789 [Luteibacter sp. UNCMF331Sha3.1]